MYEVGDMFSIFAKIFLVPEKIISEKIFIFLKINFPPFHALGIILRK